MAGLKVDRLSLSWRSMNSEQQYSVLYLEVWPYAQQSQAGADSAHPSLMRTSSFRIASREPIQLITVYTVL